MRKLFLSLLLASIACAGVRAGAAELPPGTPALAADLTAFRGTREIVEVLRGGPPFTQALRVRVAQAPEHPYSVQTAAPTTAAIARGDVLLLTFWMRAVETRAESGEGRR